MLDDSEVLASVLPAGFIYVTTALLWRYQTEPQLATVIAHKIAHVPARHGTRQAAHGQVANLASIPSIYMGGWMGICTRYNYTNVYATRKFLAESRANELEADALARHYLRDAGYPLTSGV